MLGYVGTGVWDAEGIDCDALDVWNPFSGLMSGVFLYVVSEHTIQPREGVFHSANDGQIDRQHVYFDRRAFLQHHSF